MSHPIVFISLSTLNISFFFFFCFSGPLFVHFTFCGLDFLQKICSFIPPFHFFPSFISTLMFLPLTLPAWSQEQSFSFCLSMAEVIFPTTSPPKALRHFPDQGGITQISQGFLQRGAVMLRCQLKLTGGQICKTNRGLSTWNKTKRKSIPARCKEVSGCRCSSCAVGAWIF